MICGCGKDDCGWCQTVKLRGEMSQETGRREQFEEEVWCAHKWLDDRGIPRSDIGGEVFSLVGRMMRLAEIS